MNDQHMVSKLNADVEMSTKTTGGDIYAFEMATQRVFKCADATAKI